MVPNLFNFNSSLTDQNTGDEGGQSVLSTYTLHTYFVCSNIISHWEIVTLEEGSYSLRILLSIINYCYCLYLIFAPLFFHPLSFFQYILSGVTCGPSLGQVITDICHAIWTVDFFVFDLICFVLQTDLVLDKPVKTIMWCEKVLCIGYKDEYILLKVCSFFIWWNTYS